MLDSVTIRIPAKDLLSAIWYSDGSGSHFGVPINECPDSYEVVSIELAGGDVMIVLREKP